jgi:hypothetical protein
MRWARLRGCDYVMERSPLGLPTVERVNVVVNSQLSHDRRRAKTGAEDWNRTSDTSIFSAVLYRLSYLGKR